MKGFQAEKEHSSYNEHITKRIEKAYKILKSNSWLLNVEDARNNSAMLDDGSVVTVSNIVQIEKKLYIVGRKYERAREFFSISEFSSSTLGINIVSDPSETEYWSCESISCKIFKVACTGGYIAYPIIHTFTK